MIHSVKVHFAEQDINDLQEISATLERILNQPNEPEPRRLETLKNVVAGYSNVIISLEDSNQKAIFHSPDAPDLRQFIASARPDKMPKPAMSLLYPAPCCKRPNIRTVR